MLSGEGQDRGRSKGHSFSNHTEATRWQAQVPPPDTTRPKIGVTFRLRAPRTELG